MSRIEIEILYQHNNEVKIIDENFFFSNSNTSVTLFQKTFHFVLVHQLVSSTLLTVLKLLL